MNSRAKGMRSENELCRLLSDDLGITITRNVDQARKGGADVLTLPGYAVEIKRREVLSRPSWWTQAVRQGVAIQREPIVFYRRSREPWRALVSAETPNGYKDVSWDEAMDLIRDKLQRLYGVYRAAA